MAKSAGTPAKSAGTPAKRQRRHDREFVPDKERDPFFRPLEGDARPYLESNISFGSDGRLMDEHGVLAMRLSLLRRSAHTRDLALQDSQL